jgi:hypothetical protein
MVTCVVLREDSGLSIGLANEGGGSIRRLPFGSAFALAPSSAIRQRLEESNESKKVFDVPLTLSVPDTIVSHFREWRCSQLHKPILVTQLSEDDPSDLLHSQEKTLAVSLQCSAVLVELIVSSHQLYCIAWKRR